MTRDEALKLQDAVDEALDQASRLDDRARQRMGAVNWADLACTDVEARQSLIRAHGAPMIAVVIEEASPDAHGLQNFVGRYLEQRGFKDVYVETEW